MSNGFDAYHKWLSIPPHDQPPNHYRLLGLGLFESDPDVVAAAADRQMAHVQTYKTGPHSELSQKLLNEISAAKLCLLRPQKKAAYDEQLRQQLGPGMAMAPTLGSQANGTAANGTAPNATPLAGIPSFAAARMANPAPFANANSGTDTAQPTRPGAMIGAAAAPTARGMPFPGYSNVSAAPPPPTLPPPVTDAPPRLQIGTMTILVAAGVVAVLLLVGIVVVLGRRNDRAPPPTATEQPNSNPGLISTNTANGSIPTAPPTPVPTPPVQPPPSHNPVTQAPTIPVQTSPFQTGPTPKPSEPPATADHGTKPPKPSVGEVATNIPSGNHPPEKNPPDKTNPPKTNPDKAPPVKPVSPVKPAVDPALAGKAPVPDKAAIAAVEQKLGSAAEISTADLLDQAHKSTDAAEIYVLLRRALDSAIKQGDAATAISTVDELARRFAVDSLELRSQTLDDLRTHSKTSESLDAVAEAAVALIDEATAAAKPDVAQHLAELGLTSARKSGNIEVIRKITLRIVQMRTGAAPAVPAPVPPGP